MTRIHKPAWHTCWSASRVHLLSCSLHTTRSLTQDLCTTQQDLGSRYSRNYICTKFKKYASAKIITRNHTTQWWSLRLINGNIFPFLFISSLHLSHLSFSSQPHPPLSLEASPFSTVERGDSGGEKGGVGSYRRPFPPPVACGSSRGVGDC